MGVSILYRCAALLIYNRRPERRDTMRQLLALSMLLVLAPAPAERSFKVEVSKVAWQPVEISGMPKGLQQRVLHDDKEKHVVDRKSTRLNSSHLVISYAVFCLKKKNHPADAPALRPRH